MKFLITSRLMIDAADVESAAAAMEAVDGAVYGAFKRVIEPLVEGSFSLTTETTLEPDDAQADAVFPDTPLGKMLSSGIGHEAVARARAHLTNVDEARPGVGQPHGQGRDEEG